MFHLHGTGANAAQTIDVTNAQGVTGANQVAYGRMANAGFYVVGITGGLYAAGSSNVGPDWGQYAWGNPNVTAMLEAQRRRLAAWGDVYADKVVLVGDSMGGYAALQYAATYPERVSCVVMNSGVASAT